MTIVSSQTEKWIDVGLKISVPLIVAALLGLVSLVFDLKDRTTKIEATMATTTDLHVQSNETTRQFAVLIEKMADLTTQVKVLITRMEGK
jgi:hypothetical protein